MLVELNSRSDQVRIAMVCVHASPLDEASDPHVDRLSSALCRLGHDVTVYTRRDDSDQPRRMRTADGYEVVHVPAGPATPLTDEQVLPHLGECASFLLREWAAAPPDVVHGHQWMSGVVGVLGGRRIRVPVVQTFLSLAAAGAAVPGERRRIEVLVGKEATHVAAASWAEAFDLMRAGVSRSKISVVSGGVDIDAFTPEGPRARRDRPYRVVMTGPSPSRESIGAVVAALSRVDGSELVITGRPGRQSPHDAGAVARSAMPALLRSADVVVCAPSHEPSGAVALEAMACGVPVVATAAGGLADVVVNGVTGLLVPPGEPENLAQALCSLLLDDTLRNEFGVAGRDRVIARYSWSHVAEDVLRVYAQAGVAAATTAVADPVQ